MFGSVGGLMAGWFRWVEGLWTYWIFRVTFEGVYSWQGWWALLLLLLLLSQDEERCCGEF